VLPRTLAVGIIFATLTGLTALICEEPKPADKPAKSDEKATKADPDILAMVKEWNSDKFASPPTKFREGKVVSRKLDEKATTQTKGGFVIQLPSSAPIPTPSIYKGNLYVSGGLDVDVPILPQS
jgi:hypothetical protein